MDAHEDRAALRIGDGAASAEADEIVAIAGHHRAETGSLQHAAEALGDVEDVGLFGNPLPRPAAPVVAAVTGVDDDGADCPRRHEAQKNGEDGEEEAMAGHGEFRAGRFAKRAAMASGICA